jgi:hypothetical protein
LEVPPDPKLKLATMKWATSGEIKLQVFFYAMGSVGQSKHVGLWDYLEVFLGQRQREKIGMVGNASSSLSHVCWQLLRPGKGRWDWCLLRRSPVAV